MGISTLRIVAEDAENQDLESVPDSLIDKALHRAVQKSNDRNLGMLSPHQKLVIDILGVEGSLQSGELFAKFTKLSNQRGLSEVVDRTFRKHLDRLSQLGLVRFEGDGRWRVYSLVGENKP